MSYGPSITSEPQFQGPDDKNSEISVQEHRQPQREPDFVEIHQKQDQYRLHPNFPSHLFNKLKKSVLFLTRLELYGNMIPLGAFCFAVTFIIYGFYRCKTFTVNETFMWAMMFYFGGIGQLTAGFLEYIRKNRTFPATIYLIYGGYCLTHYFIYFITKYPMGSEMVYIFSETSLCIFYSAMVFISFGVLLGSLKTNVLYILQCLLTFTTFLVRAIGEGSGSLHTKRNAAGILSIIAGFFSLFIFMSQVINKEALHQQAFPTCPLGPNSID